MQRRRELVIDAVHLDVVRAGISTIEDLFDPELLATEFEGKTFNKGNGDLGVNEIGKVQFSDYVRSNAEKIEFAGFVPLLDRIVAVLNHYTPP